MAVNFVSSEDLLLAHGYLTLDAPKGDSVRLLALVSVDSNVVLDTGNQVTVSIGGLTRIFTVDTKSSAKGNDGSTLKFDTFKRNGQVVARLLLNVAGELKADLYAGQNVGNIGNNNLPLGFPVKIQINNFVTGAYFPTTFKTKPKALYGTFGLGNKSKP